MKKVRLDKLLIERGLVEGREKARAFILEGNVFVNGIRINKAGALIKPDASVELLEKLRYVSRGGLKLEAALRGFNIDVTDKIAMDVGASTGGFTDCLLQHGAKKVYAIDVGYGQFNWRLRNEPSVVLLEKTNIRYLKKTVENLQSIVESQRFEELINSSIDIATVDVSFISLLKVIPKIMEFLKKGGEIVTLIKPQFEVGRKDVGKGGVVRDETKRMDVVNKILIEARDMGFEVKGLMESPIKGPKGNVEYFIYLRIASTPHSLNF